MFKKWSVFIDTKLRALIEAGKIQDNPLLMAAFLVPGEILQSYLNGEYCQIPSALQKMSNFLRFGYCERDNLRKALNMAGRVEFDYRLESLMRRTTIHVSINCYAKGIKERSFYQVDLRFYDNNTTIGQVQTSRPAYE